MFADSMCGNVGVLPGTTQEAERWRMGKHKAEEELDLEFRSSDTRPWSASGFMQTEGRLVSMERPQEYSLHEHLRNGDGISPSDYRHWTGFSPASWLRPSSVLSPGLSMTATSPEIVDVMQRSLPDFHPGGTGEATHPTLLAPTPGDTRFSALQTFSSTPCGAIQGQRDTFPAPEGSNLLGTSSKAQQGAGFTQGAFQSFALPSFRATKTFADTSPYVFEGTSSSSCSKAARLSSRYRAV